MTNQIPNKQLYGRWDNLPDILKEAIASETNSDIVWKTGEAEHLPQEKISIVSRLAGYVLMGFIHPEDLASEIKDATGINPNIAVSIANSLNTKIFSRLKGDLEKVYAPAVTEETSRPLVEEIKKPAPSVPAGVPLPPSGISAPKIISVGTAPSAGKIVSPPPAPIFGKASTAPPILSAAKKETLAEAGPVIIHQESELEPLKQASGFKLEIPNPFEQARVRAPMPPRPAEIEFGTVPLPKQATQPPKAPPQPQVVHYSELRTSLGAPKPPMQTRVEITAPAKPSQSPVPPTEQAQPVQPLGSPVRPAPITPPRPLETNRPAAAVGENKNPMEAKPISAVKPMPQIPLSEKFLPEKPEELDLPKPAEKNEK